MGTRLIGPYNFHRATAKILQREKGRIILSKNRQIVEHYIRALNMAVVILKGSFI